ncbi:MAG: helix-turn-helix domain-containing protein [Kiloniellales bacterium]|nr:helix-turn-helix domain-containing protein [Kiloniellales bacterium]
MTKAKMTKAGRELAEALTEVLGDVTGAAPLKGRTVNVPDLVDVKAIRKSVGMSQQQFADTFGLKVASVRNWEQGRTEPEGPAKVLLTIISRKPKDALEALYL